MVEQFNYLRSVAWLGGPHGGMGHLGVDYVSLSLQYLINDIISYITWFISIS